MTLSQPRQGMEQAISVARLTLASLGVVTLLSFEMTNPRSELVPTVALAAAIAAGAIGLTWTGQRIVRRPQAGNRWPMVLQGLDTVALVVLAVALETRVAGASWALMVIPVVVASIRLDDVGVVATWVVGSVGYALAGRLDSDLGGSDPAVLVERIAVLLAAAASVALLTRWLQEGWRLQGELTELAGTRLNQVSVIEKAARAMRAERVDTVIDTCLAYGPALGFAAVTANRGREIVGAAGLTEFVPRDVIIELRPSGGVTITRWSSAGAEPVFSASVHEPRSDVVISGWSRENIDDAAARMLSDLVANATNAIEAASHLAKARFEASHDPLTGLSNRAALYRHLRATATTPEPTAVLFVDLDRFKELNDRHGHLFADKLLVALAGRMRRVLNGNGLLARFGGDEFVVVVTGDLATVANDLGEHLRKALAEPFRIDGSVVSVTMSIGVATTDGRFDPDDLLQQADSATYAAKQSGRNQVQPVGGAHRLPATASIHGPPR